MRRDEKPKVDKKVRRADATRREAQRSREECERSGCDETRSSTARKIAFFITSQDRQTSRHTSRQYHNNRLKCMISVIIVSGKVFHCFCL